MNREISSRLGLFTLFVSLWCIAPSLQAQENPVEVSSCNLAKDPKNFDGKLIRVRAGLNVFFEDFTLEIMNCDSDQGIWLAFGGDVPGIVASTVNDEFRRSGSVVRVNGVSYGIKKDDEFHKLYALIASRHGDKPDYRVTATLTGTFLAGREGKTAQGLSLLDFRKTTVAIPCRPPGSAHGRPFDRKPFSSHRYQRSGKRAPQRTARRP